MAKIKTFFVTISPAGDVTDALAYDIDRYLESISTQRFLVRERGKRDNLHFHFVWHINGPARTTSNMFKDVRKFIFPLLDQHGYEYIESVAFEGVRWYNMDLVNNYLTKEPDRKVYSNTLNDQAALDEAFTLCPDPRTRGPTVYNKALMSMAHQYLDFPGQRNFTYFECEAWYKSMCFQQKLPYIKDPRRLRYEVEAILFFARNLSLG